MEGKIISINISSRKRDIKFPVASAQLQANYGIVGDVHAGKNERQITILDESCFRLAEKQGMMVGPGLYGENITTTGWDINRLSLGDRLQLGGTLLIVTKLKKKCFRQCIINEQLIACPVPHHMVFAKVATGGVIRVGDPLVLVGGQND